MEQQKMTRWILLISTGLACLLIFVPFIKEILLAAFFAFALSPLTSQLATRKFFHRRGWVAITLLGLIAAVIIPIFLLSYGIFGLVHDLSSEGFQKSELFGDLMQAKNVLINGANSLLSNFNFPEKLNLDVLANQFFSGVGAKIMAFSTSLAAQLPDVVLSMFIFCCALYLFLAEGRQIRHFISRHQLLPAAELNRLVPSLQKSCSTTLLGSITVGGVQALSVSLGTLLLGGSYIFLIFLITFVFSFIPVLGAAPVGFFLAFLAAVKGKYTLATGYAIVGIFSGTVDNIIRPWLVTGEKNVNGIVMLLAILGAILILGPPGLFLGPLFITAAIEVYSMYVFPSRSRPAEQSG
jgi:predicted PurR-regulated permease PerM